MISCRGNGKIDLSIIAVVVMLLQSLAIFEDRYLMNRKMLAFAGIWHTQTNRERLFRYYVISFILLYSILGQMCKLFTLDFDLRSIVFILQTFIPTVCFATLYYTCILHYMTIRKIHNYIKQDWQRLKNDIELKIMQKYAYESQLFTLICAFISFLYVSSFLFVPILRKVLLTNEGMNNPSHFPISTCFDHFLDQETYHYSILIYQIVIVTVVIIVALGCYSMYFWIIQHACARLSIIKNKINQPFGDNTYNDNFLLSPSDFSNWIIDIIQCLTRTTEFVSLVNAVAEKCYLFQMSLAFFLVIVNFVCLLQMPVLLEDTESRKDQITSLVSIFGGLFPIYINCFIGQRLMNYSAAVYNETCLVPIHYMSLKTQKLLLTTLMMNAKPCHISIGKMFVSSHEFFSDLLRTSLSFAMVLHSLQKM